MKIRTLVGALALTAATSGTALAAQQTVTLAVDNMTCASCPYIVKKALRRLDGVERATVSYQDKTATVTFDDAKTGVKQLTTATTNAGYPSRPMPEKDREPAR